MLLKQLDFYSACVDSERRSAELCSCCCDTDISEGKSDLIVSALELSAFSSQTGNDLYKRNIFF